MSCCVASSLSPGLGGLWLVPLGNIQVLACNQYLPGGLLSCSLRRDWAAGRLLGGSAGVQGLEAFPWLLSPPPGLCRSLGLQGAPAGAGFPPTLGFWRFQSLCVRWRFPLFSLIFKAFTTSSPFIHVSHHTRPLPQLPGQHSSCQRWTLRRTLPPLLRPSLHSAA